MATDAWGCPVTGTTPAGLEAYEQAVAAWQAWRAGVDAKLGTALAQAPSFVMAHVLRAWLLACGRDPRNVQAARPVLARVAALQANERERLHMAALAAALDDDHELAKARLGEALRLHPRDPVALQVAHSLDYVTGDTLHMRERIENVLPAWSCDVPGYHAVLAMHAFSLEECGEIEHAEQAACSALELNAGDARAHHVMAHVFETSERAEAGVQWLNEHMACWGSGSVVATHAFWHLALFHLNLGDPAAALALYDERVRADRSGELADLIDAAALLWRIQLGGHDTGARFAELSAAWEAHIDDAYCSFTDLHAMLAFVGARDWERAQRLERALARSRLRPTRHGVTTRRLGLQACRGLMAFGRGEDALAVTLLASLPQLAHRLGGSHAQRDVLHLTMLEAIERIRRPARRAQAARQASPNDA